MSIYSVKGKGWRYDFILNGTRHSGCWFKTKKEARKAVEARKEELCNPNPSPQMPAEKATTGMAFLELVNRRLDDLECRKTKTYYRTNRGQSKRWIRKWGALACDEVTREMVEAHLRERSKVSGYTANYDLRCLRAAFNFGGKRGFTSHDPTRGVDFFPVEKKLQTVPTSEEIERVISYADPDTQDYLWTIKETMARVGEINRLTWDDVDFESRYVALYTRKKKGGHLTPRKVPMTDKLFGILSRRFSERDTAKPWVFWHRYWSRKEGRVVEGPFEYRKKLMAHLCSKAEVSVFKFHKLRHSGASIMDSNSVPLGAIQKILGHESRRTTEIYLHTLGKMERDAMAVYERATKNSHTDSHTDSHTAPPKKEGAWQVLPNPFQSLKILVGVEGIEPSTN